MKPKRWDVRPALPASAASALGAYHPLVRQLLHNRGHSDAVAAELFFGGRLGQADDPMLLTGMAAAVDRLHRAIRTQERIVVYGDYDTDGVTATALLVQVLKALGAEVEPHIPLREEDGYGLNEKAVRKLKDERSAAVVVSVDCGIRSVVEGEVAREVGIDLIITDHHHPGSELPQAFAIINPKQPGDTYPEKGLAGVGLAYKLAQGLIRPMNPRPSIAGSDVLDLVALGTVADLAPLTGENRMLVRQGLAAINKGPKRLGLKAMFTMARVKVGKADAGTIGYMLGPRLNAAGRLESALAAYDLLSTTDEATAARFAGQLEEQNRERQELTRWTQTRAREVALQRPGDGALLFAADPDFRPGVVGLAAARLTEEFYRPAIVATRGLEETRGSGRSIPEFHITDALDQVAELLIKHGGHAAAAGFTTATGNVDELARRLEAIAQAQLGEMDLRPSLRIDADEVPLNQLSRELMEMLDRFQPCGYDNPAPVLASRGLKVLNYRTVGADSKHLKLTVTDGWVNHDAIAFGQGHWQGQLPPVIDLAYALEWNDWNNERKLQLNVKSIQASGAEGK
jgi:single-stranded-DNA-specific exonuclease